MWPGDMLIAHDSKTASRGYMTAISDQGWQNVSNVSFNYESYCLFAIAINFPFPLLLFLCHAFYSFCFRFSHQDSITCSFVSALIVSFCCHLVCVWCYLTCVNWVLASYWISDSQIVKQYKPWHILSFCAQYVQLNS